MVMGDTSTIQNRSSEDRYCIEICKGRCCFTPAGNKCPKLKEDNTCAIHSLWKDNWCNYQADDITTLPIMELIRRNLLSSYAKEVCVYVHPELIGRLNENK